jgi:carboxyl-terminal processing protease
MTTKPKVCVCIITIFVFASILSSNAAGKNSDGQRALDVLNEAYLSVVNKNAGRNYSENSLKLIHQVIEKIARSYIEPFSISELANYSSSVIRGYPSGTDPKSLANAAIHEMLSRLDDPYAKFDERLKPRNARRLGNIGIEATMVDGRMKVIAPLDGSPAQKAGVQPGDLIIGIDREKINGLTLEEAMKRIRGPRGTEVLLQIHRKGSRKIDLPVPRTRFQVKEIRYDVFGEIAYVRIAFFGPNTEKLLRKSLGAIRQKTGGAGLSGYIIDIRNNPGGLVGQAILLADAFLEKGMIVGTSGRQVKGARRYNAHKGDLINSKPILILQNGATASAAEILASALSDNHRAVIMGTRSYGKGIVQTRFPLTSKGQVTFTTHKFLTAAGKQINGRGILPHIVVNGDTRPAYGIATIPINHCPTAGKARDRMLGCGILFMSKGRSIDALTQALQQLE